jgi:hypothetical protein
VAILFIIFDLEISFLFPWSICINDLSTFAYWVMCDFFIILTVGLIYAWNKGGLEWELFLTYYYSYHIMLELLILDRHYIGGFYKAVLSVCMEFCFIH